MDAFEHATKKYSAITVELDQHTGEFYIDIEVREYWYTIEFGYSGKRSDTEVVRHDELIACRTFEIEKGVRWTTESEFEAVCMAAMVQEAFDTGLDSIERDPEYAVMQFDYIVAAHEPALPYYHLAGV